MDEWVVPARIAPLKLLAYVKIGYFERRRILTSQERGAIEIARVRDETGPGDITERTPTKCYSVGTVTYCQQKEEMIGTFVMSRKRERVSKTYEGHGTMQEVINERDAEN